MINFGDSNITVQYIQNFLKDNYDKNIHLSDEYDKETHRALIDYLLLPEIISADELKDKLIDKYTFREKQPPNKLVDGGGIWNFDYEITPNIIKFFNRPISQCFNGAVQFILKHMNDVKEFCKQFGWSVFYYSNVTDLANTQTIQFNIMQESRKQILPCKDIINMINFANNDFLIKKCFLDENNSLHGFIQSSKFYKIAYIPAKPGETFTISHGYSYACELAIGYTEHSLSVLKNEDYVQVENIVSRLHNSLKGELNSGDYEIYKIPENSNCKYLLIQMPYKEALIDKTSKIIKIKLGDINDDGFVNQQDFEMLENYVSSKKNGNITKSSFSEKALLAANINKDVDTDGRPIIDDRDVEMFEKELNKADNQNIDLGEIIVDSSQLYNESDFNKLLVIYGNIEHENSNNILNIPLYEFQTNPWAIHDCFLSYLLGSCIHKYSHIEDISWLQKEISKINSQYGGIRPGFYDEASSYMSKDVIIWNDVKGVYEYYQNGLYTGYILETNNLSDSKLIKESGITLNNIEIKNGHILTNNEWKGKIVLEDGRITQELSQYSLREIIKSFQIEYNEIYKNHSSDQIKFINGYLDPITENALKKLTYNY